MDIHAAVRAQWENFERDEPRFAHSHERYAFLDDLYKEARRVEDFELSEKILLERELSHLSVWYEDNTAERYDSKWRTQAGISQLVERMRSPSVVARATSARALWDVARSVDRRCGRRAAEEYLEWFKKASERVANTQSSDWMLHAMNVLRAVGATAREVNARDVEGVLCVVVVEFSKAVAAIGMGGWLHSCAAVLAGVHREVLAKSKVDALVTLLESQILFERESENFHAEQEFVRRTFALKQAMGLLPRNASCEGELAESYEREAVAAPSAMHKAHVLRDAVEGYRRARRPEDAKRAAKSLELAAEASRSELKPMSFTVRFPRDKVEALFKEFDSVSLEEALLLVAVHPAFQLDPVTLAEEAELSARTSPLLRLIPVRILGPEGTDYGPSTPQEQTAFHLNRAAMEHLVFRLPLLAEIFRRTRSRGLNVEVVLRTLFQGHVFEPPDAPYLARGIRHWIAGDHLSAIHVLVPLMEKVLRRISRTLGSPTARVQEEGLEQLSINGVLQNLEEKIDSSLLFELKFVLAEKGGWTLRHAVAHGLEDAGFYNGMKCAYLVRLFLEIGLLEFKQQEAADT